MALIKRGWRDGAALFILAIITLVFFWPLVLQGQWLPQGGGDLVSFMWPQYSFAAESIKSGSLPLWNPQLYAGAPFLADNQSGLLYPINLLAFVIFPQITYQVMEGLVIFHVWLAGACMYAALRVWPPLCPPRERGGMNGGAAPTPAPPENDKAVFRGGALIGAIAFMLNDVLITHIGNLNLIAVAAWLPLILALFARGLARGSARTTVLSGVVFALALLAGHAQMTAITAIGLIVVGMWQFARAGSWRERGRVIGLATLALIVAFGLSAVQLLPSLEMTRFSLRAGLSYEEATAYSLPPIALASTFSPLLFGRGASGFVGTWQRVETSYIGLVPLFLIGFAFTRKRSNPAWLFAALSLIGLLIALGKYTPIYSLIHALPVLGGLRVPARFILLTNFSLAALAALGLQRLMTESFPVKRVLGWGGALTIGGVLILIVAYQSVGASDHSNNLTLALSCLLFVALAIAVLWLKAKSAISNQQSAIALVFLAAMELIALGSTVEVERNDPTLGYQHQAVIDFLRADGNVFRIENASSAWQPDAALMHGLNDIGGIFNPLGLANYETYRGGMGNRGSALYNFLGAKYVLANKDAPPGDAAFVPVFNADPQIDVYLNTKALPRAMLIDEAQIVRSGEEAWQAIHAPEFDPSKSAVIESAEDFTVGPVSGDKTLAFGAVQNNRVELAVTTSAPTLLVMSDVFYPGWIATIDDQQTEIYPANFAFRAVRVPAGVHRVVFEFVPLSWKIGVLISGVTAAALLIGLARRKR
ncbi:MAG: YfhO family protein [Chloroflexi bacterium]|nr:YfhO family protein [Chloroflexota bacterium]